MKTNANRKPEPEGSDRTAGPVPSLIDGYRELLDIQGKIAADLAAGTSKLTPEDVRDCLASGVPLLSFDDFFPGWELAAPAFRRVVEWATGEDPSLKPEHRWASVDMGAQLFRKLAIAWYSGDTSTLPEHRDASDELLAAVGACLKPFLQARSRLLMPMVEQARWRRRLCPVCGGSPDFSFLDKEQGSRWLVCSRCDGEWLFQRLECPYCGTHDQTKLGYLSDRDERYRVYFCDACRKYIKAIDLRQAHGNVRMPLERVLTLDLDRQASANGYQPSTAAA